MTSIDFKRLPALAPCVAPGFHRRKNRRGAAFALAFALGVCAARAQPASDLQPAPGARPSDAATQPLRPSYPLARLITMARESSPMLAVGRAEEDVARTATIGARAYPNPEIALEPGRLSPRSTDARSGASSVLSIGQPIENPRLREARLRTAETGIDVALARTQTRQADLAAAIRTRFFELIRLREESFAFREDLQLTEQIRDRILLRVRVGEAPRFDLVRAETEVAVARKNLITARMRESQARAEMRVLVGPALAADFEVEYDPAEYQPLTEQDYRTMRGDAAERNPDVRLARRQLDQARRQLELERSSVLPQFMLKASQERGPDAHVTRIGAQVTLPLLNRREGPIAEALAQAERARLTLEQRRFESDAALDAAWRGYSGAQARIQAIENGILDRARAVLEIAEAAYRLGERGILEYLDAQRQFRIARNELIAARFELQSARSDMERILGIQ